MTFKDKLDEDFIKFNLNIERAVEKELDRLREEINVLKEKISKMNEAFLSYSSNEQKRS